MPEWRPPEGLNPFAGLIRVSVAALGSGDFQCPASAAMKSRLLQPVVRPAWKPNDLEDFSFGPFMAALDQVEAPPNEALDSHRRPMHEGLRAWTEHALTMYRKAFPPEEDMLLKPVRDPWTCVFELPRPDHRDAVRYEITAWGRQLVSPDGKFRELRLPVNRAARARTDAERSVAALVAATGRPGPQPEHVRVVQVSLLEGKVEPLFKGGPDEARAFYESYGRRELAKVVDSTEFRPGAACTSCRYAAACPALPRAPGLLGIDNRTRPRRSWSPSNGRYYHMCAARDHLRRLKLPLDYRIENSPAADRGRAVHDFLARRHAMPPHRKCGLEIAENWVGDEYELPPEEHALGSRMIEHHAAVCPLRHAREGSVRVEPSLTFHDQNADVVVITKPDLLYQDGDSWVWREVKTRSRDQRRSADLLEDNPQLSLAVLLIGRGELGGTRLHSRVELEVIYPDGADLEVIDPFTPAVRRTAETVLGDYTRTWHQDTRSAPRPGRQCARCEVARWCPAAEGGASA